MIQRVERFKVIEHTADIGIRVSGKTLEELFENAAYGMFAQLTDIDKVQPKEKITVKVQGYDQESLLVNWLNELLYLSATKKMFFSQFKIKSISAKVAEEESPQRAQKTEEPMRLLSWVRGEKIDCKKHLCHLEIKAATYHNLKITRGKEGYRTTIIFDV